MTPRRFGRKLVAALTILLAGWVSACATGSSNPGSELGLAMTPDSTETLEFYPGLVKGFEQTYPPRRIEILKVINACEHAEPRSGAHAGELIGVTLDAHANTLQHLYVSAVSATAQKALGQAAEEAGMIPVLSPDVIYTGQASGSDYVLQTKITQCWVKKQRMIDLNDAPMWQTVATFALSAAIYKPPFHVAFWQGDSVQSYADPSDSQSLLPEDQATIYDHPGQVLSVAFTRSVEGIFKNSELHDLIAQDSILHR